MRWAWRAIWAAIVLAVLGGIGFLTRPMSYFDAWMYLHEELSGVESRSIRVEGNRVHYLAEGPANGPVVVLVHGLGGSAEDWRNLAPYLAKAGFRVYMPDLLGYGRSARPADFSYSVRAEAGVVLGFMDALGLQRVDLGGWSMGGWIVQFVAVEHPERVARLMLFDSVGLDVKPAWDTGLFTPVTAGQLDQLDALLMPHPARVPGFVAQDILRLSRRNSWVVKRAMATMLTARDVTDHLLPELKMPVLIAWGSADRIAPIDQGETMHRLIPQSEFEVFAGCGHLAPLECAGQMGPKVVRFVEE
jgi:pimeloyl-ACP methyl ester carboxylesterase